jgi:glycosyltransferase involved in cell wall biosynthesis
MAEHQINSQIESPSRLGEKARGLAARFDAVVILTFESNWKTEPRSNRYHYATRFARHLPVIFVQMTGQAGEYRFEDTEIPNLTLLHLPAPSFDDDIDKDGYIWQLGLSLRRRKVLRPLFWIYEFRLAKFLRTAYSELTIFHATEDFTLEGSFPDAAGKQSLRQTLVECDGLVAVSEAVRKNYERFSEHPLPTCLASNGCDFSYFHSDLVNRPQIGKPLRAIYQGGINFRLDLELLLHLAKRLPHWEFRLLGIAVFAPSEELLQNQWSNLKNLPNVKWLGAVDVATLREEMTQATVGLIPFRQMPVVKVSLPLKAYEYVACGLPVVTVPIDALQTNPALFATATDAAEFADAMERVAPTRYDPARLKIRQAEAKANSYDAKFEHVVEFIEQLTKKSYGPAKANLLVLLSPASTHDAEIRANLIQYSSSSRHDMRYLPEVEGQERIVDLFSYDAMILCVNDCSEHCFSPCLDEALMAYSGLKVLLTHDKSDTPTRRCDFIERLGIQLVYTNVPSNRIAVTYPPASFGNVELVSISNEFATIQGFDTKLQEYGVGTKPRLPLPTADWFLVIDEGSHGYRMIKASEITGDESMALPCPPRLGVWGRCRKSFKKNIASAKRVWHRLPHPAKVVLRPPFILARFTYRCLKSFI